MKTKGFTLIELMVVVVILGIMVGLSIPAIGSWITNSQIRTAAEALQNGLRKAQQMAATRNGTVRFYLTTSTAPTKTFCGDNKITSAVAIVDEIKNKGTSTYWTICSLESETRTSESVDDPLPMSQRITDDLGIIAIKNEAENCQVDDKNKKNGGCLTDKTRNTYIEFRGMGGTSVNVQQSFYVTSNRTDESDRFKCANDGGEAQCLKVILSPGGRVRTCNPIYDKGGIAAGKNNPMACDYD